MNNNAVTSGLSFLLSEAEKLKMSGEHENAIRTCERILYDDLSCGEAYEEIGDNYLSLRMYKEAKTALERAVQINPRSANANYLLGFVHSALGNWKSSIDYLEQANSVESNHPEILRCLGWSIFHAGNKQQGIVLLERALTLKKDDTLILSDLGICHLNEKNFDRAESLFDRILELEPNNKKAQECMSAVKFFKKEFSRINK